MTGQPQRLVRHGAIRVQVMEGGGLGDPRLCCPAGHTLSRARLQHLRGAAWVLVTEDAIPVGFAAYRPADSDVRIVHEFLVDRTLPGADVAQVADILLSAVERGARHAGVGCLMLLLEGDEALVPFERRGYTAIVVDPALAWVRKRLDGTHGTGYPRTH